MSLDRSKMLTLDKAEIEALKMNTIQQLETEQKELTPQIMKLACSSLCSSRSS
jgi:hypothetical protein